MWFVFIGFLGGGGSLLFFCRSVLVILFVLVGFDK